MVYDATFSFQATDPAIQSDTRYEDWRNPGLYREESNGLSVQEGELLLKVDLLEVNNPAAAENFPSYIPLSILVQASLNKNQIVLNGFNYLVDTNNNEGNAFKKFMLLSSWTNRFYIAYPDQECSYPIEEYYLQYRTAKAEKRDDYLYHAPFQQIYEQGHRTWEVLTKEDLDTRFKKRKRLGKGAQGIVDEVENTATGAIKALKISDVPIESVIVPCIQFLQSFTPHLTPIEETFELDGTPFYNKKCYVMERMEGKERKMLKKVDPTAQLVFKVQEAATCYLLTKFKIETKDVNDRNILYKKLDNQDAHKGKKLKDYDYWKYSIEEYTFYVPKPEFLIKFADYDSWKPFLFKEAGYAFGAQWKKALFPQTPEELALVFSKPEGVSEDKILEI